MFQLLFGVLFISLGFFLLAESSKLQKESQQESTLAKAKVQQQEIEAVPATKEVKVQDVLSDLKIPTNLPSKCHFYFGSQSGTAEKFCAVLEDEARQIFDSTQVINFEDFNKETFGQEPDTITIVCVATHYEGEPCDNTADFVEWLKELKKQKQRLFSNLKFTIFGLGDTVYENFNAMGKLFDQQFEAMGGARIYPAGTGNSENLLTEEQFEAWKLDLWTKICEDYMQKNTNEIKIKERKQAPATKSGDDGLPLRIVPNSFETEFEKDAQYEMTVRHIMGSQRLQITKIEELRKSTEDGSTLLVTFNLKDKDGKQILTYKTAQNLAMFPENADTDVEKVLKHLGVPEKEWRQEQVIQSTGKATKHPIISPFTYYQALKQFIDLKGLVAKKTLKALSPHCSDPSQAERMLAIANSKELLASEITSKHLGLIDIFTLFPSCKPSMSALLQAATRIMPKYYTIASSSVKYPDQIKIAISLTENDGHYGQNSAYLRNMQRSGKLDSCLVFVKDSMFYLPEAEPVPPLIMVGPGTGVVPFIGFTQTFETAPYKSDTLLYFGCRKTNSDFIFEEELVNAQKQGHLQELKVAESRPKDGNGVYVQDLMIADKDKIMALLEKKAVLCICGNTKMGQDVQKLLKEWIGNDQFKEMEKDKRLIKELWSN